MAYRKNRIGLKPDTVHSAYYLNFERLSPGWFKNVVKQFVLFQATRRTYSSCRSYVVNLAHFSSFLREHAPNIVPIDINRALIVQYIQYLATQNLSVTTRQIALAHIRTLHEMIIQHDWLPWQQEPLIYGSDFPTREHPIPRYVPEQDALWLKQNISAQALPNGLCGLPLIQQRCPHANACLSCVHFRTHEGFLPQHEAQLKKTETILATAKMNGWQRQIEMNTTVKVNLETIIKRLKGEK